MQIYQIRLNSFAVLQMTDFEEFMKIFEEVFETRKREALKKREPQKEYALKKLYHQEVK